MSVWQYVGIASLLVVLAGGLFVLIRSSAGSNLSISHHIAANKHSFILMGVLLSLIGTAFYTFLIFWLIPTYALPALTYWIVVISLIAQFVIAWTPTGATAKLTKIHTAAGITIGTAMLICIWIAALLGSPLGPVTSVLLLPSAVITSVCYALLLLGIWRYKQLLMPGEVVMIAVFSVALLALGGQL